jgi:hypothetical protein
MQPPRGEPQSGAVERYSRLLVGTEPLMAHAHHEQVHRIGSAA